jgi:hypothetical protein
MTTGKDRHDRYEFSAEQVADLLADPERRLRRRGIAAAVFVVGGAAVAATGVRRDRLTVDVDAIGPGRVVLEEAAALAKERGLPENWLNPNARMWMPPLPDGALDTPAHPGLLARYAEDGFLFATN